MDVVFKLKGSGMAKELFVTDRLFTPGPTPSHPAIADAYQKSTALYHRQANFEAIFREVRNGLKDFFGSAIEPLILTSSGTGAMEACMQNLTQDGDGACVINGGKFGERWTKMARAYGLKVQEFIVDAGKALDLKKFEIFLTEHSKAKSLYFQMHETSTGVLFPVAEICNAARKINPEIVIVVDAVSSLGAHIVKQDTWKIDAVISGSQKGFGVGPGLSFVSLGGWRDVPFSSRQRFYFEFQKELKGQATGRASFTPSIPLVAGMKASLDLIRQHGGPQALADHHQRLARATRAGVRALGLEFFVDESAQSHVLTTIKAPNGIDAALILSHAREVFGCTISGGQDELKGKIIRFGHLGLMSSADLVQGFNALEIALLRNGHKSSAPACGTQAVISSLFYGSTN
jgi:serine---pyruvate transaminase